MVIGVWRAMMRRILSAMSLTYFVVASVGCQSWSQVGQGFPAGSRVAPPGTGTYNVPSSYYNGPKDGTAGAGTRVRFLQRGVVVARLTSQARHVWVAHG